MTNQKQTVVAVMQDLMFMVQIQEAAKRAGLETAVVKNKTDALRKASERPILLIIDLNYAAGEPLELIKALKGDETTRAIHILAFVSHVQTGLRAAASANGCDTVLPRSAFTQNLPAVIERCIASQNPTQH